MKSKRIVPVLQYKDYYIHVWSYYKDIVVLAITELRFMTLKIVINQNLNVKQTMYSIFNDKKGFMK